MDYVTSSQLKNRTGEIMRRIRAGERVVVTNWGRAVAIISPAGQVHEETVHARPFDEAWSEIEHALATSRPESSSWRAALRHARGRP